MITPGASGGFLRLRLAPPPAIPLSPYPRRGISAWPLRGKVNGRRWTLPGRSPRLREKAGHGSVGWRRWRRKNRRRWRRRRPPGVGKQQAQKEKSSGLTAVGLLLPPAANQDSGAGSKMVDGFTQSHETCLFLPIYIFFSLFFFFSSELSLGSVSHCDSPILSHIVCSPPKSVKASHSQLHQLWQLAADSPSSARGTMMCSTRMQECSRRRGAAIQIVRVKHG